MSIDIHEQYDKIYRYCYFKVKNATLAEDLTQESFLKYFAQTSYLDHGKQMAYLYTIARNLCMDSFHKKQTIPLDNEIPSDNLLSQVELTVVIRQALTTLPMDEQELLLLRYANQLSVSEIATFTGLSRFSIYRRTNNALTKLKKLLRKEDFI